MDANKNMNEKINKIDKLYNIKKRIMVFSGKGGVGKTTVAVNLAFKLALNGNNVGLLDADIHGPDITKMLNAEKTKPKVINKKIIPPTIINNLKIISISMFLPDKDSAVIWRGPLKMHLLKQFTEDVQWGNLDYLIVDLPPGCLTADTLIFTNQSPVPISKIIPGDYVYSFEGEITKSRAWKFNAKLTKRRVLDVIPQGISDVYELKTKTRKIYGTAGHPILKLKREKVHRFYNYALEWKSISKLQYGDIIIIVKKLPDSDSSAMILPKTSKTWKTQPIIPEYTTNNFMRIVGYFLGDGFVRLDKAGRHWGVWFSEPKNGRYRSKYISLLKRIFKVNIYEDEQKFAIISKQIAELFDKLGLRKKALEKTIPDWVFHLPISQRYALIEGYCDADGYRRSGVKGKRSSGWMAFESPNKELIKKLRMLCISVGLRVTNLNSRERKVRLPSGVKWNGTFWYFECINITNTRSKNYGAGLIRGNTGKGMINKYMGFDRVVNVAYMGKKEVYDLRIEDNHNFVANGIIVHNTGDEPLSIVQLMQPDGAVIVTTPQDVALLDSRKAVNFAKKVNIPVIGIIENMSGFKCPYCGEEIDLFKVGGGEKASRELNVPFLGRIPIDPEIVNSGDSGNPFVLNSNSEASKAFNKIIKKIERFK